MKKAHFNRLCRDLVAKGLYANEDEALVAVIKVFDAYMSGKLWPVDAAAARKLVDAENKAVIAAPELMQELTMLARQTKEPQ